LTSRLPAFYNLPLQHRLEALAQQAGLSAADRQAFELPGGLELSQADHMIENVVGIFGLPLGVALNFLVNGREVLVPMAIEEPSVVAGASYMAKLARAGGGFTAGSDPPIMIGQIQLLDLTDLPAAAERIQARVQEILGAADQALPGMVELGGGAREVELRSFPETPAGPMLVVHLLCDTRDAMGANSVNTALEAIAPLLESISGGRAHLRILSNLADRRLAWAGCRLPAAALAYSDFSGEAVRDGIVEAWAFAAVDPYRAATHNKGIMNGIDSVLIATGNDWRAAEAGAHAYAASQGGYRPLSRWWRSEQGALCGELRLPLAAGIVGGATQAHPLARACLALLGVKSARELAEILAAVGLAQNLAALRALATEGIQRGHMILHARQFAISAGAAPDEIEGVVRQMVAEGEIRLERAAELVKQRKG
jgi:hydroxymethylglutaryl-CoA reductase